MSSSCDTRFFISDNINGYSDSASSATVIPSPITDFGGRFVPSNKMADGPRNKKVRTESFYSHTLSGALNPYLELFHGKINEKATQDISAGYLFLNTTVHKANTLVLKHQVVEKNASSTWTVKRVISAGFF